MRQVAAVTNSPQMNTVIQLLSVNYQQFINSPFARTFHFSRLHCAIIARRLNRIPPGAALKKDSHSLFLSLLLRFFLGRLCARIESPKTTTTPVFINSPPPRRMAHLGSACKTCFGGIPTTPPRRCPFRAHHSVPGLATIHRAYPNECGARVVCAAAKVNLGATTSIYLCIYINTYMLQPAATTDIIEACCFKCR